MFAGAAVLLAGCSIFTSLSGLSGGADATSSDGGDGGGDLDGPGPLRDAEGGDAASMGDGSSGDAATKVARIFVFGGTTDSGNVATVLHADVLSDGTLAAWVPDPPLPDVRQYAEAALGIGFVAVVGGLGSGGFTSTTLIAKIQPGGLGAWTELGSFGGARTPATRRSPTCNWLPSRRLRWGCSQRRPLCRPLAHASRPWPPTRCST